MREELEMAVQKLGWTRHPWERVEDDSSVEP